MQARLVLAAGLLCSATQAWSLDFSAEASRAQRGEPLQLNVSIRTEPGETLRPECIKADIVDGERLLWGPDVTVRLDAAGAEGHWHALLETRTPITQPEVRVTVSAGCDRRLWKRYTLKILPSRDPVAPRALSTPPEQAPTLIDSEGWVAAGAAVLLLAAGLAWLTRHPLARPGRPMAASLCTAAPAKRPRPSGQARTGTPPARPATPPPSPNAPPPQPAVTQLTRGPARSALVEPEHQWPEVEEQANTLAAQGLLGTAVELVLNYVRSARRAHLMPYLKLLQLQRRRGDRAAFDDTRTLLEQNFKLHAPTWSGRRQACAELPEPSDGPAAPQPEATETPKRPLMTG